MSKQMNTIPMMVFRDLVMVPETSVHIDVQREDSLKAVEKAMNENLDLLVVTAKDAKLGDTFSVEDLYRVGTVVKVKQMLKLPKNVVRVMLLGQYRAQLEEISLDEKGIHMAEISQFVQSPLLLLPLPCLFDKKFLNVITIHSSFLPLPHLLPH